MKAKCIKDFSVEKCDDNGFLIENSDVVVNRNSIWDIEEDVFRFIGGEIRLTNDEYGWLEIPKELFEECFVSTEKCEVITYSLGTWDANDGKGCREHTLTSKDFEDTGYYEYLGELYEESEMEEYIERFGETE